MPSLATTRRMRVLDLGMTMGKNALLLDSSFHSLKVNHYANI